MINIITVSKNAQIIKCRDLTLYILHDAIIAIQLGETIKIRPETTLSKSTSIRTFNRQLTLLGLNKFNKIPSEKFYALVKKLELTIDDLSNMLFNQ